MQYEQLELLMDTRREWEDSIKRLGDHVKAVEAARFAWSRADVYSSANAEKAGIDAEVPQIGGC